MSPETDPVTMIVVPSGEYATLYNVKTRSPYQESRLPVLTSKMFSGAERLIYATASLPPSGENATLCADERLEIV